MRCEHTGVKHTVYIVRRPRKTYLAHAPTLGLLHWDLLAHAFLCHSKVAKLGFTQILLALRVAVD